MNFVLQNVQDTTPTKTVRKIKLEEYNPNYFPTHYVKPILCSDSLLQQEHENYPVFGKFAPAQTSTDTLYKSVSQEVIKVRRMDNDSSFSFSNGIFIFLILLLFTIAWIRVFYSKVLTGLSKAVFYYEEKNSVSQRIMYILDVVFLLNASLATYYLMKFNMLSPGKSEVQLLFSSAAIILFIYFIRFISIGLIAFLTNEVKITGEFLSLTGVYYKAGGILLFLPLLAFNYLPENMIHSLSIFTLLLLLFAFIMPMYRGLTFAIKTKFLFFYYFLYFCAVEILPVMLTIKYFGLTSGFFTQN
jgi:hypothetical protein